MIFRPANDSIAAGALIALGLTAAPALAAERAAFDVYLGDNRVGEHVFEIEPGDDGVRVTSRAEFDVKFLGLTLYRYRHQARELWRDGCIAELEADTDDNGERIHVEAEQDSGELVVRTGDAERRLDSCVRTFAYWDPQRLEQPRLLNPQTGEYVDVAVAPAPQDDLGESAAVERRLRVKTPSQDIVLAYGDDARWVALESELKNGRTLRYRRREDS